MRPLYKHMMQLLLLWLMLYCFGMSILYSESGNRDGIRMLYQRDNPIGGVQAMKMLENEENEVERGETGIDFTVWGTQDKTEMISQELGKKAVGSAFYVAGDASLLFAYEGVLSREDEDGCLLSKDLAYRLFGSVNVTGLSLEAGGRTLTVRGILQEAEGVIVLNAAEDTGKIMDAAVIRIPDRTLASSSMEFSSSMVISSFQNRYGFGTDTAAVGVFRDWSKLAVTLIPVCMGICLFVPWGKALYRGRKMDGSLLEKSLFYFILLGSICFLVFYVYIAEISIRIPQDFLPTRWSDFSFWNGLFEEKKEELLALFTMEIREPERILMNSFLQTVKYSVFTLVIYVCFFRKLIIINKLIMKKAAMLYIYILCSICFAYSVIFINREYAQTLADDKRLWLLVPVYLTGVYLLKRLDKAVSSKIPS